jgi:hypothetical protein
MEISAIDVRDAAEIERGVAAFARFKNGGLIVTASALSVVHRDLIIALAGWRMVASRYATAQVVSGSSLIVGKARGKAASLDFHGSESP